MHAGLDLRAGGKKKEEKKAEKRPLLKKAAELKSDDEKDTKLTKSRRKVYTIALAAGETYQLDLVSKDFDAFLRLEDSAGNEVAFNDDANPATLDSRIVYKASKASEYKVIVNSYDAKAGKFNLTVVGADKKTIVSTGSKFKGKAIAFNLKDRKGRSLGELTENDNVAFKRYYKLYTLELEKDKTCRIENRADDPKTFDAYLFLEDADGTLLDSASGESRSARIIYKAAKSGTRRVIVTTARTDQTGKFTLDIRHAADAKKDNETTRLETRVNPSVAISPVLRHRLAQGE
jgi:hypothetical protein